MSMRACWTTVEAVDIEITTDFTDQHGSEVEEFAIGLFQDQDGLVIEGTDVDNLREFVARLTEALDTYEREHADAAYDEWVSKAPEGVTPKDVTRE